MHALVKTAFTRLYVLVPAEEERKLADNDAQPQDGETKLSVSASASAPSTALEEGLPSAKEDESADEKAKDSAVEAARSKCKFS